jgi:hypothetical protein
MGGTPYARCGGPGMDGVNPLMSVGMGGVDSLMGGVDT